MSLKNSTIAKLLEEMYLVRMTDTHISEKYSEQKMRCPIHLSIGQEGPSAPLTKLTLTTNFKNCTYKYKTL